MSGRVRMAENGAQLYSRIQGRRSLKEIDQNIFPESGGPVPGDVIEFHGVEGSGKTETLCHLVSRCILPACAGGLEVEVMFVDTDHHFDMLRLVSVLETRLTAASQEVEELVRSALRRLSVLHCSSSAQLLLTLHSLEGVFCGRPALCLLVIDSVSSFYWPDRAGGGDSLARQEANLRKCTEILDRLRRDHGVVVFATTHAIMRNYSSGSTSSDHRAGTSAAPWRSVSDFDRPYLCRSWQKVLTHRLVFSKTHADDAPQPHGQCFQMVCSSVRIKASHRRDFHITDAGLRFHKGL